MKSINPVIQVFGVENPDNPKGVPEKLYTYTCSTVPRKEDWISVTYSIYRVYKVIWDIGNDYIYAKVYVDLKE